MLTSGLDITMATLDAGLGTVIPPEKTAQLKDMGKVGLMAHDLFQRYRKRRFGTGLKMYADVHRIADGQGHLIHRLRFQWCHLA